MTPRTEVARTAGARPLSRLGDHGHAAHRVPEVLPGRTVLAPRLKNHRWILGKPSFLGRRHAPAVGPSTIQTCLPGCAFWVTASAGPRCPRTGGRSRTGVWTNFAPSLTASRSARMVGFSDGISIVHAATGPKQRH